MKKIILGTVMTALLAFVGVQSASAVAPANSTITNTATLTYTGNAAGIQAKVDVKVTLVATAPAIAGGTGAGSVVPADNTVAEGQPSTAQYSLIAQANGPDQYNLTSVNTATNLTGVGTVSFKQGVNPITSIRLGATAASLLATAGSTSITVPSDGVPDNDLNGIANGDFIVIGANTYKVNVVDNANGTSTINLIAGTLPDGTAAPTALAANVAVGTLIAELQTFNMEIANAGAKTVAANASFIDVRTTAASLTDTLLKTSDTHRTNVVQSGFEKLIRNVTAANGGIPATVINGLNYYPTAGGVTAKTGDVLEYAIRVTAPTGAALTGVTVTDAVPTFTTYVANSTRLNGITVANDGATSPLVAGLLVDDNTARTAAAVATGNIAAGAVAIVTFQVTVQ